MKSKLFLVACITCFTVQVICAQTTNLAHINQPGLWAVSALAVATEVNGPTVSLYESDDGPVLYFTGEINASALIYLNTNSTGWVRAHAYLQYYNLDTGYPVTYLEAGEAERDIDEGNYQYQDDAPYYVPTQFGVDVANYIVLAEARKEAAGSNPYALADISVRW